MAEITRLKKRRDYLKVQGSDTKQVTRSMVVSVCRNEMEVSRLGITVSTRVDKRAVVRNRLKRRLREAGREILPPRLPAGYDIVLIGRREGLERAFKDIKGDLRYSLKKLKLTSSASGPSPK